MSVSDYVRACCHQDLLAELDHGAIRRAFEMGAEKLVQMAVAARATTLRMEEKKARVDRAVEAVLKRR